MIKFLVAVGVALVCFYYLRKNPKVMSPRQDGKFGFNPAQRNIFLIIFVGILLVNSKTFLSLGKDFAIVGALLAFIIFRVAQDLFTHFELTSRQLEISVLGFQKKQIPWSEIEAIEVRTHQYFRALDFFKKPWTVYIHGKNIGHLKLFDSKLPGAPELLKELKDHAPHAQFLETK